MDVVLPRTPLAKQHNVDCESILHDWLKNIESALSSIDKEEAKGFSAASKLFHDDSWWRDHLALQWDFRTIRGRDSIVQFLAEHQKDAQLTSLRLQTEGQYRPVLESPCPDLHWIRGVFNFESKHGLGTGVVRLTQETQASDWKAYAVYTSLQEFKQFREPLAHTRPEGNTHYLPGGKGPCTWAEKRAVEMAFEHEQPTVLVVGGGQSGLDTAARLGAYGISCLIVERNPRIGDNWRNRYRTLTTHDPVVTCHMPYLPFPKTWPQFTPKDKLADWFEAYASIMELNVWTNSSVVGGKFDKKNQAWSIDVQKKNGAGTTKQITLHPRHVVWATGHSGEPKIPQFPGQDKFEGEIYHASKHHDASQQDVKGKKVVVVGTGNSGHDIAENFYLNGADVTMLQRSPTYVCTQEIGLFKFYEGLKDENTLSIDDADIIGESLPIPVRFPLAEHLTKQIEEEEKTTITGLEKAGFQLDRTPLWKKYVTTGGGYYIDIGCSQLIIDGKVKIHHSPNGIKGFGQKELVLADGKSLPADIVVLATGYDNMRTSVRKVLGDEIANQLHDVWNLDSEGELNAMWRPRSGLKHFWYMAGNLALCRYYSKMLALQIAAIEKGINKD